jgi:hypothetical protein
MFISYCPVSVSFLMSDPIEGILRAVQQAELQLKAETQSLTRDILLREQELKRARALFNLFQERRYVEDVKNRRICQPPIFYEAWNRVIGRLEQVFKGADQSALPQMYESFENTMVARTRSQRSELLAILG